MRYCTLRSSEMDELVVPVSSGAVKGVCKGEIFLFTVSALKQQTTHSVHAMLEAGVSSTGDRNRRKIRSCRTPIPITNQDGYEDLAMVISLHLVAILLGQTATQRFRLPMFELWGSSSSNQGCNST